MFKVMIFAALWGLLFSSGFAVNTDKVNISAMTEISQKFFIAIKNDSFNSAADLFHYPSGYSEEELKRESLYMRESLKLYKMELGSINDIERIDYSPATVSVFLGGGNPDYWEKYPYFIAQVYRVTFSRDGLGFIAIRFTNIKAKLEIRSVHYGLPASRADAKTRINEILRKALEIPKKFGPPSKT